MAKEKLTDLKVKALKPAPAGRRYETLDAVVPGLGVRVTDKGQRTFVLISRYPGSRNPTRRALGEYPKITLEKARDRARQWLELLARGIDPRQVENEAKEAARVRRAHTYGAVAESYIVKRVRKQRQGRATEREIRKELISRWQDRPITNITKADVIAMVEEIAARAPRQAHNMFGRLCTLMNWVVERDIYGLAVSPCDRVRPSRLIGPKTIRQRVPGVWADGVYLQARMEDHAECMLVLIGATPEGRKELVGFQVGVRESAQSWRELLLEVKRRGLAVAPEIAVGDGALGFWKAVDELYPGTHHQRCWVHKTANVLNTVPKSVQASMKADLREIHGAPTRAAADVAIGVFVEKYGAKYAKGAECLTKDRDALLAFYDFPAEHWDHLRTSSPIESVFATVRHRTVRTKGSLSPSTARLMVFKLVMAASKTWRRLKGENQLPKVLAGVTFHDGTEVTQRPSTRAA